LIHRRLRIALLCHDLARNSFGRAYVLARVLARDHSVHVVGPQFGPSVWPPFAGLLEAHGVCVTAVPSHRYPRYLASAVRLRRAIGADTDVIYAAKPYPTSLGLGLSHKQRHGVPLILDIDDWELGIFQSMGRRKLLETIARGITSPNNYLWLRRTYAQTSRADAITVSSSFLQRRFGGTIVVHGRDTAAMDPGQVDRKRARQELGVLGQVVMFLGSPRPHKGVEDLIAALHQIDRPDVTGLIIGARARSSYTEQLKAQAGERVRILPLQPFSRVPALLSAADVVVVPQRQAPFAEAQVPAKIFDAMAMGRPIVATAVSDIPDILSGGCGLIVTPGDVGALAEAIAYMLDDPAAAERMGLAAREKCVREFSWENMQSTLRQVIDRVAATC